MHRILRLPAIAGMWIAGGLATGSGTIGLLAQEVVDLPEQDLRLSTDFELVYRIGSTEADAEWEEFFTIRSVGFDGAGNLYLLDGAGTDGGRRVVVADAAGSHAGDFGRPGDGPGEFQMAMELIVWDDGRTLVRDMMRGYHVFGPGGEFERTVREAGQGIGLGTRAGLRPERTGSRTVVVRDERSILRIDMSSAEVEDRVLVEGWAPRAPTELPVGADFEDVLDMMGDEWGFEPELLFDPLPSGGVAFSDSSAYAIKVTDSSGRVSHILRRAIRPLPVTERMRRTERERRLQREANRQVTQLGGGGEPPLEIREMFNRFGATRRAALENMRFYPEVPVVAAVHATWEGSLWVQRSTEPGTSESGPIDVLAEDGRYVGTFPVGRLEMPDAFGPDGLAVFVETDEFDVPVITVRRLPEQIR